MRDFSDTLLSDEALTRGASAMMKTFDQLKGNPSELLLALHTFGRHHASAGGRGKVAQEVRWRLAAERPKENVSNCSDRHYSHPE